MPWLDDEPDWDEDDEEVQEWLRRLAVEVGLIVTDDDSDYVE